LSVAGCAVWILFDRGTFLNVLTTGNTLHASFLASCSTKTRTRDYREKLLEPLNENIRKNVSKQTEKVANFGIINQTFYIFTLFKLP